jgi:hypothetical protein
MWNIAKSVLYRASLSNPFAFDATKFARKHLGSIYLDPTIKETKLPPGRSTDSYQAAIDQYGIPFQPPAFPMSK